MHLCVTVVESVKIFGLTTVTHTHKPTRYSAIAKCVCTPVSAHNICDDAGSAAGTRSYGRLDGSRLFVRAKYL